MIRPCGIIFDFDGVLVDTEWAIFQSWVRLYTREGCSLSISDYAPCLGAGYSHWDPAAHLESLTGKSYDWPVETAARQAQIEHDLCENKLMPGALRLLHWCQNQGIRMTVASSSSRRWVGGWLERLDALPFFPRIFCRTDGYAVKPAPDLFLAAQDFLALPAEQCLIVEDSENGTIAARNAGIPCVAIPNRMTERSDLSAATYRCDSLSALLHKLQESSPLSL